MKYDDLYDAAVEVALARVDSVETRKGFAALFRETQQRIDADQVSVVVLAARRMTSVYALLVKAGMPPLTGGLVVSDRFYDSVPTVGQERSNGPDPGRDVTKVLVLDDSVVVGSTLFELVDTIRGKTDGPAAIELRSVCHQRDSFAFKLFSDLEFDLGLPLAPDQLNCLSGQLVQSLFEHQVPFFSDFPVTEPLRLQRDRWHSLLQTKRWLIADVTAPFVDDVHDGTIRAAPPFPTGSVSSFTFVPSAETTNRLRTRVAPSVSALLEAIKVRLFVFEPDDQAEDLKVVAVPLTLLAPTWPTALESAIREIAGELDDRNRFRDLDWTEWEPVALHRIVQLYGSACVLTEFWSDFAPGDDLEAARLDKLQVALYFGESDQAVSNAFDSVVKAYAVASERTGEPELPDSSVQPPASSLLLEDDVEDLLWAGREILSAGALPPKPEPGQYTKVGIIFAHVVCGIFGYINREYELRQRDQIAGLAGPDEYRSWLSGTRRVLKRSLTLRELTGALLPRAMVYGSLWDRQLVSLGIDVGNDLGIVVPVTRYDSARDIVYRCYRLGEAAFLAERTLFESVLMGHGLDPLAGAVERGFAAKPSASGPGGPVPDPAEELEELRSTVAASVPGKIDFHYEGVVTEVVGRRFIAEVASPSGGDQTVADIPYKVVPEPERTWIVPGAQFRWTTFLPIGVSDSRTRIRFESPLVLPGSAR